MAADWIGISSAHYDSHCGEEVTKTLAEGLDGTDLWSHQTSETHWFIVDLGATYNVQKVRGRSFDLGLNADPVDVNIYVSNDKEDFGEAVASGINTWANTAAWQEVDTTDKEGRYVKVEIIESEDGVGASINFGGQATPFTIFDVYGDPEAPSEDVAVFMGTNF